MSIQHSSSARLQGFFLELVHKSFSQLGVGDRPIIEYIAGVLTEFSHILTTVKNMVKAYLSLLRRPTNHPGRFRTWI